jgi:hypothetical protein
VAEIERADRAVAAIERAVAVIEKAVAVIERGADRAVERGQG